MPLIELKIQEVKSNFQSTCNYLPNDVNGTPWRTDKKIKNFGTFGTRASNKPLQERQ